MNNYIQLVLVQIKNGPYYCNKPYLFRAPFSEVSPGEKVRVETEKGIVKAKVIFCDDFRLDGDMKTIMAIVEANGASWPLKRVVARICEKPIEWEDETIDVEDEAEEDLDYDAV